MGHFSRAEPFGTWVNGYNPTATDLTRLDLNQQAAIDGDGGGAWAPTTAITIAGQGLQLSAPLLIAYGGTLTSGTGSGFRCGNNNYPVLGTGHAGATRTILTPFAQARGIPSQCWMVRTSDGGLQAFFAANIAGALGSTGGTQVPCAAVLALRPVDGATLTKVTINFRVPTAHPLPPLQMPKVRVVRLGTDGSSAYLTSVAAGASADGFVSVVKPTTGAGWTMGGAAQSLTVTCDQNNAVAIAQYTYQIEIADELYATTPQWPFVGQSTAVGTFAFGLRGWAPSTVYAGGGGVIVLPTNGNQTGLYYTASSAGGTSGAVEPVWPTAIASSLAAATAQVLDGTVTWIEAGSIFPYSALSISPSPASGYAPKAFGTVWHSALATYTNIVDTRPQ